MNDFNRLIKDYLTSRNQLVKFNGEKSNLGTIEFGVPQGSVLGPLLFLIYINDIINCSKTSRFVLFADDTNIFISANNESEAYEIANKTLEDLQRYMLSNQLHINLSKCTYMHFRPDLNNEERQVSARTLPHTYHLKHKLFIRGVKIKKVDKVRFLGVIIDDKLKWDAHISHLETRLLSSITMIKRIRKFIPRRFYSQLYYSLFQSYLVFGISAWGGACSSKLVKVFALQKRCIRLLFGINFTFDHSEFYETCARVRPFQCLDKTEENFELENTKPIFNENRILTVHNLYTLSILTETFKIKKLHTPSLLNELLPLSTSSRRNLLLKVQINTNLSVTQHNFIYKAAQVWNKIIPKILNSPELDIGSGVVIPGSSVNSDLTTPIPFIKKCVKKLLYEIQRQGDTVQWLSDGSNFSV